MVIPPFDNERDHKLRYRFRLYSVLWFSKSPTELLTCHHYNTVYDYLKAFVASIAFSISI